MLGTALRSLHSKAFTLHNNLLSRCYCCYHSPERDTQAQKGQILIQGHGLCAAEQGLAPRQTGPSAGASTTSLNGISHLEDPEFTGHSLGNACLLALENFSNRVSFSILLALG